MISGKFGKLVANQCSRKPYSLADWFTKQYPLDTIESHISMKNYFFKDIFECIATMDSKSAHNNTSSGSFSSENWLLKNPISEGTKTAAKYISSKYK